MATTYCQCTLCEAHCGIVVETEGGRVGRIAGDPDDPQSRGYICPKGAALADLHEDPDRLRQPVRKVGEAWVPIGWEEALDLAADGLKRVQAAHGPDAVATYLGNPGAHSSAVLVAGLLRQLIGGVNHYSAASTDQLPQYRVALEMFGHFALLPVADIDRTDHMLILGANPAVSNGSVMTAPGVRDRLRAIAARGGRIVVVDPRRTETARLASEHVAVAPGGDPYLLLGMIHTLFAGDRIRLGRLDGHVSGLEELELLVRAWAPERCAELAGVPAGTIARLARELSEAERAVVYGRVGVCQQPTGTLTHWLINVLNVITGHFDAPGGSMFTTPAVDILTLGERALGRGSVGRYRQRISGLPEFTGELPVAGLADEILEPGEGRVRGMVVYAGNPVLSNPGGRRLDTALADLEFMVSVDMYITETSRHADVILPPVSHLERDDIDVVLPAFAVRNHIRFNPAALPKPAGGRTDWEILMGLAGRIGRGALGGVRNRALRLLGPLAGPERLIDLGLRAGPYGVLARGPLKSLSIGAVKRARHGIDLGPLEPRLPGILRTPGRRVRLAPPEFLAEAGVLAADAAERAAAHAEGYDLVLIGRRQLRSNNSWMHNAPRLMKGRDRCTALLHPDDAAARGLLDGQRIEVSSRIGSIEVPLEVSDEMRPGVVSIPHGFGHDRSGVGWRRAAAHAGASVNDITDPALVDRLTGNTAFNALPVRLQAIPGEVSAKPARVATV